ncbi:MAG: hypothetical protein ACRD3D_02280, partial [Terriglobia bacterium]
MMRLSNRVAGMRTALFVISAFLPAALCGQSAGTRPAASNPIQASRPADSDVKIRQLERQIQAQRNEIARIEEALTKEDRLRQNLASTHDKAAEGDPADGVAASPPQSSPPHASRAPSLAAKKQDPGSAGSELPAISLNIGHATLTPFGFVDATAFFRTRNLGSGIGAAFGSLPFSNSDQGRLSEVRFSAQNSRFGLQYDSEFDRNRVRGYMETDFLGVQPGNAFVTSNSDSLRLRLYWVDLTRGRFEFLAGQSWSLLTPSRNGISPEPSQLFYTQDMDTNYQVGLTWARQLQFRFVYHATPHVAAALSLENPEQYAGSALTFPAGFDANQVSTGSNTTTPNAFPDVIGKLAFDGDPGGHHVHAEITGLFSSFKTYNAASDRTFAAEGGGGSIGANYELFKNFRLFATSYLSDGGGRYLDGLAPDLVLRPNGRASLIRSEAGIGGFEFQATPDNMLYGYYGEIFIGRNYSVIEAPQGGVPAYVGYGFPGASPSANRAIQEATFGVIRTFWKSPQYGALQL